MTKEADTNLLKLCARIRRLRMSRALSQEELADRAHLHRNYIGGIERGERNVGVKALLALSVALDVAPAHLFIDS